MAKHHPKARQRKPSWRVKSAAVPSDEPQESDLPVDRETPADGGAGPEVA
jgi:hypothetical protein